MTHALLLALALSGAPAAPSKGSAAVAPASSAKELARAGFDQAQARLRAGVCGVEEVCLWAKRLRDAAPRAEADDRDYLERLKRLLATVQERVKSGLAPPIELLTVQFLVAEAESDPPRR